MKLRGGYSRKESVLRYLREHDKYEGVIVFKNKKGKLRYKVMRFEQNRSFTTAEKAAKYYDKLRISKGKEPVNNLN